MKLLALPLKLLSVVVALVVFMPGFFLGLLWEITRSGFLAGAFAWHQAASKMDAADRLAEMNRRVSKR